jgi:hypothetical protein
MVRVASPPVSLTQAPVPEVPPVRVRYAIRWSRLPEAVALCASAVAVILVATGLI